LKASFKGFLSTSMVIKNSQCIETPYIAATTQIPGEPKVASPRIDGMGELSINICADCCQEESLVLHHYGDRALAVYEREGSFQMVLLL
jgi:hypothetical protein